MENLVLLTVEQENEFALKVEEGQAAYKKLAKERTNLTLDEIDHLEMLVCEGIKARDSLIMSNTRLVYHMAKDYVGRGVAVDDLHQCGLMGLQKAAEDFRAGKDAKFSTYASYKIKDALNRCVINTGRAIRLPNQVSQSVSKYKRVYRTLENENGVSPSIGDIAKAMGMKESEVLHLIEISQRINSLDTYVDSDKENTFTDLVADNSSLSPLEKSIKSRTSAKLYPALKNTLDEREFFIISGYFGLDGKESKTFEELGRAINLSRERTRQLFNNSLVKLRESEYANELRSLIQNRE